MEDEYLFPEDLEEIEPDEDVLESGEAAGYVGAPAFDGDFVRDGKNCVRAASPMDAWKQWCVNCLSMERYASPLYSSDFGISLTEILQADTRAEAEAMFRAEAKEALEADPYGRTDYVGEITFDWGSDSVKVTVEVVGIDGAAIDFEVNLEGR
ncbi:MULTISPECIES: DUF2634 domain-containing protein [Anaerotruncus]|uniref:contractile injection system sheath initiator n=1 Tax=Anaerotruncus TaxID=244127 RepID=UPI0013621E75